MQQASQEKKTCFVIMPFSETTEEHTEAYWTDHFAEFLKPLIESAGPFAARRSEALRGDIVRTIISDLVTSPIVVADLTDRNPNVYWELGIRQSFRHGTITIAQEGTELPSDLGGKGTLLYSRNRSADKGFQRLIAEALADCVARPEGPDSEVLEVVSGRGTLFELYKRDEASRRLVAVIREHKLNRHLIETAIKCVECCTEDTSRSNTPIGRALTGAVERLLVDRYLDESEEFYLRAEMYFANMIQFRGVLESWPLGNAVALDVLGRQKLHVEWTNNMDKFLMLVNAAKERLAQR